MKRIATYIFMIVSLLLVVSCQEAVEKLRSLSGDSDVVITLDESNAETGKAIVNGVKLTHLASTSLREEYRAKSISFQENSADIFLGGSETLDLSLQIKYLEYEPSDASFSIGNGRIKISTKSGKPALIVSINGRIPSSCDLVVESGNGDIGLKAFKNNNSILVSTGSGNIEAVDLTGTKALTLSCGSGDILMRNSNLEMVKADTGSGDISIENSVIVDMEASTGSGDIAVIKSQITNRQFKTGSGVVSED